MAISTDNPGSGEAASDDATHCSDGSIGITDEVVQAGTVLHFDFDALGGVWPEMQGAHPAVVLTPVGRQKNRTVIVVPLSSKTANAGNPAAVELEHRELCRASPTGRAFAICNLPVTLALDREGLAYYRGERKTKGNELPRFQIGGDDLKMIRALVMEQMWNAREFHALIGHSRLFEMLRERREATRKKTATWSRKHGPKSNGALKSNGAPPGERNRGKRASKSDGRHLPRSLGPMPGARRPMPRDMS